MHLRCLLLAAPTFAIAACTPANDDGIDPQGKVFDGIAPQEAVTMIGTEPFWNLDINGTEGLWIIPDNQPGTRFGAKRFAGNGGLSFSGTVDGKPLIATLTPGTCSDGMSDRTFPYVATIALGGETFEGCGYTDRQPFTGDEAP